MHVSAVIHSPFLEFLENSLLLDPRKQPNLFRLELELDLELELEQKIELEQEIKLEQVLDLELKRDIALDLAQIL